MRHEERLEVYDRTAARLLHRFLQVHRRLRLDLAQQHLAAADVELVLLQLRLAVGAQLLERAHCGVERVHAQRIVFLAAALLGGDIHQHLVGVDHERGLVVLLDEVVQLLARVGVVLRTAGGPRLANQRGREVGRRVRHLPRELGRLRVGVARHHPAFRLEESVARHEELAGRVLAAGRLKHLLVLGHALGVQAHLDERLRKTGHGILRVFRIREVALQTRERLLRLLHAFSGQLLILGVSGPLALRSVDSADLDERLRRVLPLGVDFEVLLKRLDRHGADLRQVLLLYVSHQTLPAGTLEDDGLLAAQDILLPHFFVKRLALGLQRLRQVCRHAAEILDRAHDAAIRLLAHGLGDSHVVRRVGCVKRGKCLLLLDEREVQLRRGAGTDFIRGLDEFAKPLFLLRHVADLFVACGQVLERVHGVGRLRVALDELLVEADRRAPVLGRVRLRGERIRHLRRIVVVGIVLEEGVVELLRPRKVP